MRGAALSGRFLHRPLEAEDTVEMTGLEKNQSWLLHSDSSGEENGSDEESNRRFGQEDRSAGRRQGDARESRVNGRDDKKAMTQSRRRCRCFLCWSQTTCMIILLLAILIISFANLSIGYRYSYCWTARDELSLLMKLDLGTRRGNEGPWPLQAAHSHNDYLHSRPLQQALMAGFCSVEADVFLLHNDLYLGHDLVVQGTDTLESVYLRELKRLVLENDGQVYTRSLRLGTCLQVVILVDIKSMQEPVRTWEVLEEQLERLDTGLPDGRSIFETINSENNIIAPRNNPLPSPIQVIITGIEGLEDEILKRMRSRSKRKVSIDLNAKTNTPYAIRAARWLSVKWEYTWPLEDASLRDTVDQAIRDDVEYVRRNKLRLRYWHAPDDPELWDYLLKMGVDIINTDSIFLLHSYLTGQPVLEKNNRLLNLQ